MSGCSGPAKDPTSTFVGQPFLRISNPPRAGFRVGYLSWRGVMETTLYSRSLLSTSSTCSSILSF